MNSATGHKLLDQTCASVRIRGMQYLQSGVKPLKTWWYAALLLSVLLQLMEAIAASSINTDQMGIHKELVTAGDFIKNTRPTAVNLSWRQTDVPYENCHKARTVAGWAYPPRGVTINKWWFLQAYLIKDNLQSLPIAMRVRWQQGLQHRSWRYQGGKEQGERHGIRR